MNRIPVGERLPIMSDYQVWPDKYYTHDGLEVAFTQAATFFNNNTMLYGWNLYESGMTKQEYKQKLMANWFDEDFADLFIKKKWSDLQAEDKSGTD
jgi:hypothetical protein